LLPTGWALHALHKLVSFGEPAGATLSHLTITDAAAVLAGWLPAPRFPFP